MIVILLGPPGSGKGTQAKKFSLDSGLPQLSTGDMLRAAMAKGSALGLEAKSYMDKGALVPDTVVIGLIAERIVEGDCHRGFILDGFPRTIPQAEALEQLIHSENKTLDRVVLFEIKEEELIKRLSGRRTCLKCGSMYHLESAKPSVEGVCNACGSGLIQREDDRAEVIKKRLHVYQTQTSPLADFYRKSGKLKSVDAARSPAEVYSTMAQILA